jgi:hypothetical protein
VDIKGLLDYFTRGRQRRSSSQQILGKSGDYKTWNLFEPMSMDYSFAEVRKLGMANAR